MFLEVKKYWTVNNVWAFVLSNWRTQLLFIHFSGRLHLNALMLLLQNFPIKLPFYCLTMGDEFLVDNSFDSKKNIHFILLWIQCAFLATANVINFHCNNCCFHQGHNSKSYYDSSPVMTWRWSSGSSLAKIFKSVQTATQCSFSSLLSSLSTNFANMWMCLKCILGNH